MAKTIRDLSVIFLAGKASGHGGYWQDLLAKCPWAHSLEAGGPRADVYAAAAVRATTSHFVTVEPDCIVAEDFFSLPLSESLPNDDSVMVWPATNVVNNLCYEHGAIRCWPRSLALSRGRKAGKRPQKSEITAPRGYATLHVNDSPNCAFSYGFHEAIRLATRNGRRVTKDHRHRLPKEDYRRLLIWMSVGADVDNGLWAIYGARLGCKMASLGALELRATSENSWLTSFWQDEVAPQFRGDAMYCEKTAYGWDPTVLEEALGELSTELRRRLDLPLIDLDAARSQFFKTVDPAEDSTRLDVSTIASVLDRLANGHRTGRVAKDTDEAARLYRLAVALGSTNAKVSLGRIYRDDLEQPELAIRLLTEAANEGHAEAAFYLGQIYNSGQGVLDEPRQALQYYRLAARRGVGEAMLAAGEMLIAGTAGHVDPVAAVAFFYAARSHGTRVPPAQLRTATDILSADELARAENTALDLGPADHSKP